ncbi:MAG: hypothetical protein QME61_02970 [Patescibacteria group bacterium]|nr:hypothetical protein [Patescibacteria group bacterium]
MNFYKFREANFHKFLFIILILILVLSNFMSLAEENEENLEEICQWERIEERPENFSDQEYEALLKKCQSYYQEKSKEIEKDITKTEKEKKTLQNKIYILSKKIENLNYQIYQSNLIIRDLGIQAQDTEASIGKTSFKIEKLKEQLVNILQLIYEEGQKSLIEILLSEEKLSDFFNNLMALEALNSKNQELLQEIKNLKTHLENQKQSLEEEKRSLEKMVAIQSLQKKESAQMKKEQEHFLRMTEAEYQQYLKQKKEAEEKVAKISEKLWKLLIGVREIPEYGKAVKIAKFVSEQTGVRAAFLLGILTQESLIGRNIGQCFLKDFETGMGVIALDGKKWPRVMRPNRDIPIFLEIIENLNQSKNLNLKSDRIPISCWIPICSKYYKGPYCQAKVDSEGNITCAYKNYSPFGWGGAMGPAQFISSTWNLYKDEIKNLTGEVADPWDFRDASLAAALLLRDCGALSNERSAAVCYLGADYLGYADSVLWFAKCHQDYIDTGSMSLECQKAMDLE